MSLKKLYGEIAKVEDQDDGTIIVEGYASAETVDADGETITADAMKAALPDYMKFANIREMHQPKAAGVALSATTEEDGRTKLSAHIVDEQAVKKVKAGVYKGFSIGGRVTDRDAVNKTVITGLKLSEISLVDRPANPDAVITCYKGEDIEPQSDDEELPSDDVQKGMYAIADFADTLADLRWFVQGVTDEADFEQDNSPLPQKLKDWLASGVQLLKELTEEETSELLAALEAKKSAHVDDLQKAGSRNNKTDQATLNQVFALLKQLGATDESEEPDEDSEKIGKLESVTAERDDLQKRYDDLMTERDTLQKRVSELEAQPEPAKVSTKAIAKGEDVTSAEDLLKGFTPITQSDGSLNEAATLMKAVHAGKI